MLYGDEHVRTYQATNGEEGYDWVKGTTILLLTTVGRRTGESRTSALIFRPYGEDYLVVASKGGADEPPAWYLNLQADPTVRVQIKDDTFVARARTATSDEKPDMWKTMVEVWPDYDSYQTKTDREIPIVVLERQSSAEVTAS
jgi:deazaflavin-dependent oxidoreductase (nitroreductase family)